ncbi:hypothetical protein GCM10011345_29650 [Gemmobacter megaterium]|nr:hypothetical protein GCM10011345_29650 [Gemmobacter megaterium]
MVKGDNPVNFGRRHAKRICDLRQNLGGDMTEPVLHIMQNGKKRAFPVVMPFDNSRYCRRTIRRRSWLAGHRAVYSPTSDYAGIAVDIKSNMPEGGRILRDTAGGA